MTDKKQKKRAAGYIRVSSEGQIENTSLPEQRRLIKKYCEDKYKLTEIYADEGISGRTTSGRPGIQQAINDARAGKFDALIVKNIKRFGREPLEILLNIRALKDAGVELVSVTENLDDELFTLIKAGLAAQEVKDITERMQGGKISKARRGIPPPNLLPFGRTFDEKNMKWGIDENKKRAMEWVYKEYVEKDRSLQQIALEIKPWFDFSISYDHLLTVLKERCGTDEWEVNYKALDEPIKFTPPPLLSDDKIQAIKDRIAHNRTNNRTDAKDYLLSGFLWCMNPDCHKSLSAQTQRTKYGDYGYFVHPHKPGETCREFTTVPIKKLEEAIFQTIFETIYDAPSFERAIKESLPDETYIENLKEDIKRKGKRLDEVNKEWNKIKKLLRKGIYKEDEVLDDINELREIREKLNNEIADDKNYLATLPDPEEVKKEADQKRRELKRKYQSEEHLQNMSFKDKKMLLHYLFDGQDAGGVEYGIYIDKRGKGKKAEIDYMMYGRITGLRTIKGDDIDYYPDDNGSDDNNNDPEDSGWTIIDSQESEKGQDKFVEIDGIKRRKKNLRKSNSTRKKSHYKTNNFDRDRK